MVLRQGPAIPRYAFSPFFRLPLFTFRSEGPFACVHGKSITVLCALCSVFSVLS